MPHSSWNDFLTQQGLDPNSDAPTETDPTRTWLMPLVDQSLLQLEGPDTEKFLQGQLSCNLDQLSPQRSLLGANCTPKGMVISAFRLFQPASGSVLLRLPQTVADAAQANLQKYSVFSKTELSRADEQWVGIGLMGEQAPALLERLEIDVPEQLDQQCLTRQLIIVRVAGEQPRFEIWCPTAEAQSLWQQLAPDCSLASSKLWQACEIKAGLVQLSAASTDSYLPQMLNLQAVDGISFNKGCYTGQEVVARLQFRGKLKKLMYAASVATPSCGAVTPGSSLYSPNGRVSGKVLNAVGQGDSTLLQAIVNKSAADDGQLHLDSAEGPAVSLLALPYPIDPELFERPER